MNTRFDILFTAITLVSLATACGSANDTPENAGPAVQAQSLCGDKFTDMFPIGLTADPPFDFVVRGYEEAWSSGREDFRTREIQTIGDRCGNATNPDACVKTLQGMRVLPRDRAACETAYPDPARQSVGCATKYFRWTRGDEIGQAVTREEVLALMGNVDSVEEAKYLLETDPAGFRPTCQSPVGYEARAEANRFVFRFMENCEKNGVVHVVIVHADGRVEVGPSEKETRPMPCQQPSGG